MSLSVIINTKNAASTLARAVQSIQSISDEVIVVDMMSSDETLDIARGLGCKVFSLDKDYNYVEPARNIAISKAIGEWILVLDADEELPQALSQKIAEVVKQDSALQLEVVAYRVARCNLVFGKWLKHTGWWPDYQLRLFRRGSVKWQDSIHSIPEVSGEVADLPESESLAILHHNYQTISQFVERLNRYTSIEASHSDERRKKTDTELTPEHLLTAFYSDFLRRFFALSGIQDGMHGAGLSLLQSMYQSVSLLKRWEKADFSGSHSSSQLQMIGSLRSFQRELNYWIADWHAARTSGVTQLYWRLRRKLLI